MVLKIRYFPIADIVDYFKEIHTLIGPIECTSIVTQITLNLGCPKMAHMSYIERDVSILGLGYFVCAKSQIVLFLCCMREVVRQFGYLTRRLHCTLTSN
jgi:hypothetical protein